MASIGQKITLTAVKEMPAGMYLDAGELGDVLLPRNEVDSDFHVGGTLEVFLYRDSEDRPTATSRTPRAIPGEFAKLKCKEITQVGAFLDWGLQKDLLVPFREQTERMTPGKSYLVKVMIDQQTDRLVASARLTKHLNKTPSNYVSDQQVKLIIFAKTPLGYKAIINNEHTGLLFQTEIFRELHQGEKLKGWIANVRADGKFDLTMQPPGRDRVDDLEKEILGELVARGGFWAIHDKSPASEIQDELGVSKRTFKQSVGALMRKRLITVEPGGLRLN